VGLRREALAGFIELFLRRQTTAPTRLGLSAIDRHRHITVVQ
jgi:hypothetical protein